MNNYAVADLLRHGLTVPLYERSVVDGFDITFFLTADKHDKRLGVWGSADDPALRSFAGEASELNGKTLLLGPLTHGNAAALRNALPWLRPGTLGLATSAGCGDRLGLATPGHIRAARAVGSGAIGMIFAQQSIREMTRTGRSADEVIDDATWGIFQEGWREGSAADADHLKTTANIEYCAAAGFTFFTIDPSDHVDEEVDTADELTIRSRYEALPWEALASSAGDLQRSYRQKAFDLGARKLALDDGELVRAAVKYGRAVAHVAALHRHLVTTMGDRPWELEVSVDETETPTSHAEHLFIANELRRLGVKWVSLAPRYTGRFEKGVDYIGDVRAFEADFAVHASIAPAMGPYKLSLHSGSDKFSIYGIASRLSGGLLHLKTAGTSYLEALRALAGFDPALFREILAFSIERYETDKASYHLSAQLAKVPRAKTLSDEQLPRLLDQFDARQVLHVTFGSILLAENCFRARLLAGLSAHEENYHQALERHFVRHLTPLAQPTQA